MRGFISFEIHSSYEGRYAHRRLVTITLRMGQPNGTHEIRWRSKIGPQLGENMFAQLAALPSWSHDRQEPGPMTLANDNPEKWPDPVFTRRRHPVLDHRIGTRQGSYTPQVQALTRDVAVQISLRRGLDRAHPSLVALGATPEDQVEVDVDEDPVVPRVIWRTFRNPALMIGLAEVVR